jgi:uroporphyrinogen decarboxylase
MNSLERVMTTLAKGELDRLAVFAVLGAYGGKLNSTPLFKLYRESELWVKGQMAIQDRFKLDMVLGTFDFSGLAEAFGGRTVFFDNQAPNMRLPAYSSTENALEHELPDIETNAILKNMLAGVSGLKASYQNEVPVVSTIPGPTSLANLVIGIESWLDSVLFEPEIAEKLHKHLLEFWFNWMEALVQAGTDFVVVCEGMASNTINNRDMYLRHFHPWIRDAFQGLSNPVIFHHTGGAINHVIDELSTLPNVAGFVVGSKDDLFEARSRIHPDQVLIGNIDNLSFPSYEPQTMRDAVRERAAFSGKLMPYIVANSAADIPLETPIEIIDSYSHAAGKCSEASEFAKK